MCFFVTTIKFTNTFIIDLIKQRDGKYNLEKLFNLIGKLRYQKKYCNNNTVHKIDYYNTQVERNE